MKTEMKLIDSERQRLQRIIAYSNLTKQRNLAIPFFVLAALLLIVPPLWSDFNPIHSMLAIPFAMVALVIGLARLGQYKLFRLIHYLAAKNEIQDYE